MVACVLAVLLVVTLAGFSESERWECFQATPRADTIPKYFKAPKYKDEYVNCEWRVEAARKDWTIKIEVVRTNLNTGYNGECIRSTQRVDVYDGSKEVFLGRFCGKETPTYYSSTNRVSLKYLSSDGLNPGQYVTFKYSADNYGQIGDEDIQETYLVAVDEVSTFSGPGSVYRENTQLVKYSWLIKSNDPDLDVFVRLLSLSLPSSCKVNYLAAYDEDRKGTHLVKWCDNHFSEEKVIRKESILVILHAKDYNEDTKFEIEFGVNAKETNITLIVGLFVGGILFLGLLYLGVKMICAKCDNKEDDDNEAAPGNQTLLSDVTIGSVPPPTEPRTVTPTAPPIAANMAPIAAGPSAPPPSYEEVVKAPEVYSSTSLDTQNSDRKYDFPLS